MPHALHTLIAFAVVLGVLVFIHEMGHYLAARWRGVHAEAFSIGFGRPLVSWTDRRGTVWKISALPLGGYVKLHGMANPAEIGEQDQSAFQAGRTFFEKSVLSRAIVVAAGPLANFALAIVLFAVLFASVGMSVPLPVVGEVLAGSAAAEAGLAKGDRIEAIAGTPIRDFQGIQAIVARSPDQSLPLTVSRDGKTLTLTAHVHARVSGGERIGMLGISSGAVETHRLGPVQAIFAGTTQTWSMTRQTLVGLWHIIASGHGTDELGGPLRIAQLSGQVAELGVASLVNFVAVLSINLGLLNLFPIPVLDGGHLLFFLAEALRGRPLPLRAQEYGYRAGFALIAGLFVFATLNDLTHLGVFRWVAALIG
ncbi:MAG TPA: RIP metalloprotease RseP [Acetobacteraceae bacterium]|nr:RIP metalloprotease RseP [Acetobacteraceae bacterium]